MFSSGPVVVAFREIPPGCTSFSTVLKAVLITKGPILQGLALHLTAWTGPVPDYLLNRDSQPQHHGQLGSDNSVVCVCPAHLGCAAASPGARSTPSHTSSDNQKCLQTLSSVSRRERSPSVRTTTLEFLNRVPETPVPRDVNSC